VQLKYLGKNQKSVINSMKRVSKPGRRIYKGYRDMKPLLSGLGYSILSTPQGIMTDEDARKQKLGGELLCEVW
jgi:small subunit ribosomal protein S8